MQRFVSSLVTGILLLCAILVSGLVVRRELFSPARAATAGTGDPRVIVDWRAYAVGHRMGPSDAAVTVVDFSDFQCPFCHDAASRLREIRRKHPEKVAVVYRHYPLSYHASAAMAARASICAARQQRFEAMHDAIFASQDSLNGVEWSRLAEAVGVPDRAEFDRCIASTEPDAEVKRDVTDAERLGIQGTPTLMVNDQLLTSAAPGALEAAVERALRAVAR